MSSSRETQLRFDAVEQEIPASQPLATIEAVRQFLVCSEDRVSYLCESGQIRFAFDLASPGARRREVRIFLKSVWAFRRGQCPVTTRVEPADDARQLNEAVLACIPPGRADVKLARLAQWWLISPTHLHDLLSDTTLVKISGQLLRAKQSPGLDRASVAEFLKGRRIV